MPKYERQQPDAPFLTATTNKQFVDLGPMLDMPNKPAGLLAGLKTKIWERGVPGEVEERYRQLAADIQFLRHNGCLPEDPGSILDVGSGSGGGSVALRMIYPGSRIVAIDSGETH